MIRERPSARRWLLLLGLSRDDAGTMHAVWRQLAAASSAHWLTAVQRFPADDEVAPQETIRCVEAALGRDRGRRNKVAIDIDLLAYGTGTA